MSIQLLVPLDGSRDAESSLAVALPIARQTGAFVTVLHAVEPEVTASGKSALIRERDIQEYLAQVVRWLSEGGIRAARLVRDAVPSAAATISAVAAEVGADVIVLSSRGHGAAQGRELGRLAREVLVSGAIPFLLVRPFVDGRDHPFICHRLLVPLDGSGRAETALPTAHMLAEALGAELLLVWVLPPLPSAREQSSERPGLPPADRPDDERFAQRYLDTTASGLGWGGITITTMIARGEPVRTILGAAGTGDMLVLATHGHTGNPAVWAGSVASRLVERSEHPVLVVRSSR
jgi:nucleotide-binding universal stress UspA family protein